MKVLSLNVGLPRKLLFNGQTVTTGIFKDPVRGPIMLRKLNHQRWANWLQDIAIRKPPFF